MPRPWVLALALAGQTQSRDVGAQRLMAIPVPEHGQLIHVGGEAVGTRVSRVWACLHPGSVPPISPNFSNTVVLIKYEER